LTFCSLFFKLTSLFIVVYVQFSKTLFLALISRAYIFYHRVNLKSIIFHQFFCFFLSHSIFVIKQHHIGQKPISRIMIDCKYCI
jgi:hypothetical protein